MKEVTLVPHEVPVSCSYRNSILGHILIPSPCQGHLQPFRYFSSVMCATLCLVTGLLTWVCRVVHPCA